jgi:hypothetical protein
MTVAVEAADAAAESIRVLNHATISGRGYAWPSQVDAVVGCLEVLAQRLPQALDQASSWLAHAHADGRVGHDHGIDPDPVVEDAVWSLRVAARQASALAGVLQSARTLTSHLTGMDPGHDPDDATAGATGGEGKPW